MEIKPGGYNMSLKNRVRRLETVRGGIEEEPEEKTDLSKLSIEELNQLIEILKRYERDGKKINTEDMTEEDLFNLTQIMNKTYDKEEEVNNEPD